MPLLQKRYASGTAYTLTATPAYAQFGTTSPQVIISAAAAKTRVIRARAVIDLSACTLDAVRTITLKLRKTSDTAADVANSSTSVKVGVIGTSGQSEEDIVVELPEVVYTVSAETPDTIQLWASIDSLPATGAVTLREASIIVEY